jgi:hypothetical protein
MCHPADWAPFYSSRVRTREARGEISLILHVFCSGRTGDIGTPAPPRILPRFFRALMDSDR